MRWAYLLGVSAVLCSVLSCTPKTPTQIFLHADADPLTQDRAAFLRATVVSQEGEVRLEHEFPLRGPAAHEWPIDLSILPQGGDASRRVTVRIAALDATLAVFNERMGRYSFVPNELLEATIYLQDACIGVMCAEGSTCDLGACVPVEDLPMTTASGDDQDGVCSGDACWEHPRPAGRGAGSVCAWGDEGGAAVLGGAVV